MIGAVIKNNNPDDNTLLATTPTIPNCRYNTKKIIHKIFDITFNNEKPTKAIGLLSALKIIMGMDQRPSKHIIDVINKNINGISTPSKYTDRVSFKIKNIKNIIMLIINKGIYVLVIY